MHFHPQNPGSSQQSRGAVIIPPHPSPDWEQNQSHGSYQTLLSWSFNEQQQSVIFLLFAWQVALLIHIKRGRRR